MYVHRKNVEDLANAVIVQAANDYLESKKQIYQYGETFNSRSQLNDAVKFFKSDWYEMMTSVSSRKIMRTLDKQFEEWRKEYDAKMRKVRQA